MGRVSCEGSSLSRTGFAYARLILIRAIIVLYSEETDFVVLVLLPMYSLAHHVGCAFNSKIKVYSDLEAVICKPTISSRIDPLDPRTHFFCSSAFSVILPDTDVVLCCGSAQVMR